MARIQWQSASFRKEGKKQKKLGTCPSASPYTLRSLEQRLLLLPLLHN
jgi:hypothetical protein